jgi:hypothetical protein
VSTERIAFFHFSVSRPPLSRTGQTPSPDDSLMLAYLENIFGPAIVVVGFEAGGHSIRMEHNVVTGSKKIYVGEVLHNKVGWSLVEGKSTHVVQLDELLVVLIIRPKGFGFTYTAKLSDTAELSNPILLSITK